ncbi:helicase [Seminavis robusta]|uniref:Helicase n=1 Tax=Seminavis robusta TaxID=568900 RepID=A0A9N8EC44_9STRA|nr:helicase [Seminavis robusta]|eukprot:Sro906_g218670.1 helicase (923) ;mRNA; f:33786-36623
MATCATQPAGKTPAEERPLKFWAIKKSGLLKSPAIFTCVEDCKQYAVAKARAKSDEEGDNVPVVEYKEFQSIWDAVKYIMPWQNLPAIINNNQQPTQPVGYTYAPPKPPPVAYAAPAVPVHPPPQYPMVYPTPTYMPPPAQLPKPSQLPKHPSSTRKPAPAKKPGNQTQAGRKGDPRMNRAVAARTENPTMPLFEALQIGGFEYPNDIDPYVVDDENVTLGQRKNQLSRRLRVARKQPEESGGLDTGATSLVPATVGATDLAGKNRAEPATPEEAKELEEEAAEVVAKLKQKNMLPAENTTENSTTTPQNATAAPQHTTATAMTQNTTVMPQHTTAMPQNATVMPQYHPALGFMPATGYAYMYPVMPAAVATQPQPTVATQQQLVTATNTQAPATKGKPKATASRQLRLRAYISWEDRYKQLIQYKEKYGSAVVQKSHILDDDGFQRWVAYERKRIKKVEELRAANKPVSSKDAECVKKLQDIGFATPPANDASNGPASSRQWGAKRLAKWEANFKMLQEYKEKHGVSAKIERSEEKLYRWVSYQARAIREFQEEPDKSCFTKERIDRLLALGVNPTGHASDKPSLKNVSWDEMYNQLVAFKQAHGTVEVPHYRAAGVDTMKHYSKLLRNWTLKMREDFELLQKGEKSDLTPDRMEKLTKLGFRFQVYRRMNFDHRAAEWLEYKAKHGKDPPSEEGDPLASWVSKVRKKYWQKVENGVQNSLTEEQIDKLKSWGFNFERKLKFSVLPRPTKCWEERFQDLLEFKEKEGHCNVPQTYPELGTWVHSQRRQYRKLKKGLKSTLNKDKIERLVKIGFQWITRKSPTRPQNAAESNNNNKEVHDFSEYEKHMAFVPGETTRTNNAKKRPLPTAADGYSDDDSSSDEEENGLLSDVRGSTGHGNHYPINHNPLAKHGKTPWDRYRLA